MNESETRLLLNMKSEEKILPAFVLKWQPHLSLEKWPSFYVYA